jgi:hypothetical protein
MAGQLAEHGSVVLVRDGERQPLPLAVRRDDGLAAVRQTQASGRRALFAAIDRLDVGEIPEADWRRLDPEGLTIVDIDRPVDLDRSAGV